MNQQHLKEEVLLYSNGAAYSVDIQYYGLLARKGTYTDARNMRLIPQNNNNWATNKIGGEQLLYPLIYNQCLDGTGDPLPTSYKGMLACFLNNHLFEIWGDVIHSNPIVFRVDGKIVAMSDAIPFSIDFPFQFHTDDTVLGAELYLTDFNVAPHIYLVKDLMLNSGMAWDDGTLGTCTPKYFADYNDKLYSINLVTPLDHPVLIEETKTQPVGSIKIGTGGFNAGYVQYAIQFVDDAGNVTALSCPTPLIPIVANVDSADPNYPFEKTYGAPAFAGTPSNTVMGLHIKCRITNVAGYTIMNLVRCDYFGGTPLNAIGSLSVVYRADLTKFGTYDILDIWDEGATGTVYTPSDQLETLGIIEKAKAIRYFDKQLYLMNIFYKSRDIKPVFLTDPDTMYPVMYRMGQRGHKDPYNATYYKANMHGEKNGWAVVFWDNNSLNSFAVPIPGSSTLYPSLGNYNNFKQPTRRFPAQDISDAVEGLGVELVTASDINYITGRTFEVFDLVPAVQKGDVCRFKNIFNNSDHTKFPSTGDVTSDYLSGCAALGSGGYNSDGGQDSSGNALANYQPFHPCTSLDDDISGNNSPPCTEVVFSGTAILKYSGTTPAYNPKAFGPSYSALGMGLRGIDASKLPEGIAAMSLVRTPSAGAVTAQGAGFYKLRPAQLDGSGSNPHGSKSINTLWFYSPDIENGLVDVQDIINNPDNYKVQIQSPLGMFSETFNFQQGDSQHSFNIDMMMYARILFENNLINAGDTLTDIGINTDGYVSFQTWRNQLSHAAAWDSVTGDKLWSIASFAAVLNHEGTNNTTDQADPHQQQTIYSIELTEDIYANGGSIEVLFNEDGTRNFHEPIYVLNIIRVNADIDTSVNEQQYLNTGHYQKLVSIIGQSSGGNNQSFRLIDERYQDCIVVFTDQIKFVYVEDANGIESTWVNVSLVGTGSFTLTNIYADIDNGTNTSGANPNGTLKGVYTQVITNDDGSTVYAFDKRMRFWDVVFSSVGVPIDKQKYYIPTAGSIIKVKYDNRYPLLCFGGDSYVGESTCAMVNGFTTDGGETGNLTHPNQLAFEIGLPYQGVKLNPRNYRLSNATPGQAPDGIEDVTQFCHQFWYRQMCLMFACSSRIDIPHAFNLVLGTPPAATGFPYRHFPNVSYVMRPNVWDPTKSMFDNQMFDSAGAYVNSVTGYPELSITGLITGRPQFWGFGGIMFHQSPPNTNINYSHEQNNFTYVGKPVVGFTERNWFPTRAVWSDKRPINIQNTPNLKNFPAFNFKDINDDTGEIKKAWDSWARTGNNLYAFTEHGICLLLVNKFLARQQSGDDLALVKGEGGSTIEEEVWISKAIGMNDQMWRSFASYRNTAYFANRNSIYRFEDVSPIQPLDEKVIDIGRKDYHSRLYLDMLSKTNPGYTDDITGFYNIYNNEYWVRRRKNGIPVYGSHKTCSYSTSCFARIGGSCFPMDVSIVIDGNTYSFLGVTDQVDLVTKFTAIGLGIWIYTGAGPSYAVVGTHDYGTLTTQGSPFEPTCATSSTTYNIVSTFGNTGVPVYEVYDDINIVNLPQPSLGITSLYIRNLRQSKDNIAIKLFSGTSVTTISYNNSVLFTYADGVWSLQASFPDYENLLFVYLDKPQVDDMPAKKCWIGFFDYDFDQFAALENKSYGIGHNFGAVGAGTYILNIGNIINDANIEAGILQGSTGGSELQTASKEFVRYRIASSDKPIRVEFYDSLDDFRNGVIASFIDSSFSALYLKNYFAYEAYVPRHKDSPFNRQQGLYVLVYIRYNGDNPFSIVDSVMKFKILK